MFLCSYVPMFKCVFLENDYATNTNTNASVPSILVLKLKDLGLCL